MIGREHRKATVRIVSAVAGVIATVCGINLVLWSLNNGASVTSPLAVAGIGIAALGLSRFSVSLLTL